MPTAISFPNRIKISVGFAALLPLPRVALTHITKVIDDQSTPVPGAVRDYVHQLSESVNPANGWERL